MLWPLLRSSHWFSASPHSFMSVLLTAPDATFRDLLLAIRKDEATHREVNHTFANLKENDDNPFLAEEEYRAKITTMGQPTPVAEKKA